ncbi:uncharacterized protein CTRU02_207915 [Colletotrichum truncatum]|uniref:Uncharacterized protein n=1 Tax=Colletotrichum truncatum TaxID=5467 RepID=A0ACC3Z284_COLTU|nr:uncharacterized protein CTRU02_14864 [Colletotrichum truncatum]KAF6781665.1 hypothetical protein CTRU02_14864 [Colletotrichum truncatum]
MSPLAIGSSMLIPISTRNEAATVQSMMDVSKDPASKVVSSIWSMIAISTVFLFLRVYCKKIRSRGMWVDDYLLVLSWVFLLISNGLITELMKLGFGTSIVFVPHMHTLTVLNDVINKISLALSKTSFAATMLRVSYGWQKSFIWFLVISMNIILATSAITTWKAACDRPMDSYEAVLPGSCWNVFDSVIMAMVSNGYSVLVDFSLSLLPWRTIWQLQLNRHEKVGVAVAMSLGITAGVVGAIKVVKIATVADGVDIPYRLSLLFIWGQAEPNVTIIASSIPVLRVLFREIYATSVWREGGEYLKSSSQSTLPTSIGMVTLEEGRKTEDKTGRNIPQLPQPMRPCSLIDTMKRAREPMR